MEDVGGIEKYLSDLQGPPERRVSFAHAIGGQTGSAGTAAMPDEDQPFERDGAWSLTCQLAPKCSPLPVLPFASSLSFL